MTYEARCILQHLKILYELPRAATKEDILALANAIADGSVTRTVTASSHRKGTR
jgi:hypothetical protein